MPSTFTDIARYGFAKTLFAAAHGVRLVADVPEKRIRAGRSPMLSRKRQWRLDLIRRRGILFVHVPKNAGTSICHHLYGEQVAHASLRYYRAAAPDLVDSVPSFCILRDPVDRFVSAYRYAKDAGSPGNRVSAPFFAEYAALRGIDDAIDHVAGMRDIFRLDHIFRPQSWYVTTEMGCIGVDHVVHYDALHQLGAIHPALRGASELHLNASRGRSCGLSAAQRDRIRMLYRQDYELIDRARVLFPVDAVRVPLRRGAA